jgi:hypothetical protein
MDMIRGTDIDSWMIGLYVWKDGGNYCDSGESAILSAGFDGNLLTYHQIYLNQVTLPAQKRFILI